MKFNFYSSTYCFWICFDNSHCVKSDRIRSYSGSHFPSSRLNTERYSVSLGIQYECGKIRTITTPNTDTFDVVFNSTPKCKISEHFAKSHLKFLLESPEYLGVFIFHFKISPFSFFLIHDLLVCPPEQCLCIYKEIFVIIWLDSRLTYIFVLLYY